MSLRHTFGDQGATMPTVVGIDEWMNLSDQNPTILSTTDVLGPNPLNWWTYGQSWSDYYNTNTGVTTYWVQGNDQWLYRTPVQPYIYQDLAVGAFWGPQIIAPGETATIIHYIGLGCASSSLATPSVDHPLYVAATEVGYQQPTTTSTTVLTGVRALKLLSPSKTSTELYPGTTSLGNPPLIIKAYMYNTGSTASVENLSNCSCTLTLPTGLQLDSSENGAYSKSLPNIAVGKEQSVAWLVDVNPNSPPTGPVTYYVSYSASPAGSTTVQRDIYFPWTSSEPISAGWQMVSVPFNVATFNPISALGLSGVASSMWQYNASTGYAAAQSLTPGQGYWVHMSSAGTTSISQANSPVGWSDGNAPNLDLQEGWNIIGNPYVYGINVGQLMFYTQDLGQFVDFDTAVADGLINGYLFHWDSSTNSYDTSWQDSTTLLPWEGYWIYTMQPGVIMNFGQVTQLGAGVGPAPATTTTTASTPAKTRDIRVRGVQR
jgi:hypothetical protein